MTAVAYQKSAICQNIQQNTNEQELQSKRFLEYPNPAKKANHGVFLLLFVKF